ncbi:aldehyde dehydrogenase family protein [Streptomyces sp. NPDC006333]|uniref:aldehyde dehydrogenase family protein n=1 Tax=Streptomyces sp. NPDC006333 TaxID=3156753 RepID=UPI0033B078BC
MSYTEELGGKPANIILPGADLKEAVTRGLASAWSNSCQVCGSWDADARPGRIDDDVVALAVEAADEYTVGDPTNDSTRLGFRWSPRRSVGG